MGNVRFGMLRLGDPVPPAPHRVPGNAAVEPPLAVGAVPLTPKADMSVGKSGYHDAFAAFFVARVAPMLNLGRLSDN